MRAAAPGRANVLTRERLQQLLAKERSHDDYLFALRAIRAKTDSVGRKAAAGQPAFSQPFPPDTDLGEGAARDHRLAAWGYRRAMTDLALSIVNAGSERTTE